MQERISNVEARVERIERQLPPPPEQVPTKMEQAQEQHESALRSYNTTNYKGIAVSMNSMPVDADELEAALKGKKV